MDGALEEGYREEEEEEEEGRKGRKGRTHRTLQRGAELELIEAHEAAFWVHDAVVVVHGQHEAACEGVAVHPGDGGHGIGEEATV